MIYITLLDQFHPGIYSSQVIDVCDYLNSKHKANIRIVAFLSIRELMKTNARRELKKLSASAIVLPAFPGLKYFQCTSFLLCLVCLFTGNRIAICRNVFCAKMALQVKKVGLLKKVIFDGRSAMTAEIMEYDVFPVDYLRKNVSIFESDVVRNADFRMAVSEQLVNYWRKHFEYQGNNHVVIPCTLDRKYFGNDGFLVSDNVEELKRDMGIGGNDIVLVYSGSTAPWQSFELLESIFSGFLQSGKKNKILFLSKESKDNLRLQQKYPNQVIIKWVNHEKVLSYLQCCDYGILVREQSDTNLVASPTKFSEYLNAGLKVLVSKNLGDFSSFVQYHNCGYIIENKDFDWKKLRKVELDTKRECFELSKKYFGKESEINEESYKKLMNFI